eukprot:189451-Rhodomonas_salina.4
MPWLLYQLKVPLRPNTRRARLCPRRWRAHGRVASSWVVTCTRLWRVDAVEGGSTARTDRTRTRLHCANANPRSISGRQGCGSDEGAGGSRQMKRRAQR